MLMEVYVRIGHLLPDRRRFLDVTKLIRKMDAWGMDRSCVLRLSETPEANCLECDTEDSMAAWPRPPTRLIPIRALPLL